MQRAPVRRLPPLPRERPLDGRETFTPIELAPSIRAHLRRVEEGGQLQGRLHVIESWSKWTMPERVAFLRALVEDTARDPAIARKAISIVREARVPLRDHRGEWSALLRWVQRNIRFTAEPDERIQSPQYTLTERYGDCLPATTPLLRDDFELVPIQHAEPGMRIWGLDRWSTVEAVVHKGTLAVDQVKLNNGSSFRATPGHKVYVESCETHGPTCPDLTGSATYCKRQGRAFTTVRIPVSDLAEGMVMLTPKRLPFGKESTDPRRAYVEGLYLADGWAEELPQRRDGASSARFSISGKDGHPKEAQKREVAEICAELGVETRWHARYLAVNDTAWAKRLAAMGKHAPEKRAASIDLAEDAAAALLRGLMADSGANTNGPGRTYSTTSAAMAVQVRLLWKMFGRTCSWRYLEDHGGLGANPIYRLGVRVPTAERAGAAKRLKVKRIDRAVAEEDCYDIQTDDHYVYLPEADVTVSNCDDLGVCLAALAHSIRLPWKFVISGRDAEGNRVRWVEGERFPEGASWTHIYVLAGWPPFKPGAWAWAEPTLDVPLGTDAAMLDPAARARRADLAGPEAAPAASTWKVSWPTVFTTVLGSTLAAVLSYKVVSAVKRAERRGRRRR